MNALSLEGLIYTIIENSKNQRATHGEIIKKVKVQRSWVSSRSIKLAINKLFYNKHVVFLKGPDSKFYVAITLDLEVPPNHVSANTVEVKLTKKENFFNSFWNNIRKLLPF